MKDILKLWSSWLWAYIKPLFKILTSKATPQLFAAAAQFIIEAETNPDLKDGGKRKKWVAAKLKEMDLLTGDKYADMVIGMIIDLIVLRLSAEGKINVQKILSAII
jgi:hypothetical protein